MSVENADASAPVEYAARAAAHLLRQKLRVTTRHAAVDGAADDLQFPADACADAVSVVRALQFERQILSSAKWSARDCGRTSAVR